MEMHGQDAETHPDGRVRVDQTGAVGMLTLDRPAKRNGLTPKMLWEFCLGLTRLDGDDSVRCILVDAAGDHFCAGLDLPKVSALWEKGEPVFPPGALHFYDLHPPYRTKPMVVAVQGACYTAGLELALSADVVVAADDSRFALLEARRGISPGGGATIRLVQRAGWGNAMRYLLTGDEFDAATAQRLNVTAEIVPPGQQRGRAIAIATRIAESGPLAVQSIRKSARIALDEGAPAAAAIVEGLRNGLLATEDGREGVRSFLERRAPVFSGR